MNKLFSLAIAALLSVGSAVAKDVEVKGYTKKDWTVAKGYAKKVAPSSKAQEARLGTQKRHDD